MSIPTLARQEPNLSIAVTALMKGVVYRDSHPVPWSHVMRLRTQVLDYVSVLGLTAVVDESEGYAFLRSKPDADESDGEPAVPRLVARRQLSFHLSLLLALLRKKLAEADASASDTKLVLSREQIVDLLRVFLPSTSNEARIVDVIDGHLAKAVELGFLRKVGDQSVDYEVRRVLKAFVDAQWLADFDERLAGYATELAVDADPTDEATT